MSDTNAIEAKVVRAKSVTMENFMPFYLECQRDGMNNEELHDKFVERFHSSSDVKPTFQSVIMKIAKLRELLRKNGRELPPLARRKSSVAGRKINVEKLISMLPTVKEETASE